MKTQFYRRLLTTLRWLWPIVKIVWLNAKIRVEQETEEPTHRGNLIMIKNL